MACPPSRPPSTCTRPSPPGSPTGSRKGPRSPRPGLAARPGRLGRPHSRPHRVGKTLAGFLMAIDDAYRAHLSGAQLPGTPGSSTSRRSRLWPSTSTKTWSARWPRSPRPPNASASPPLPSRSPCGPAIPRRAARSAMVKGPPTILVTTPESLYLYLTAERSRATLTSVRTIIVDEIHALARGQTGLAPRPQPRAAGAHPAGRPPQRVGLSATQRPIEVTARILSGAGAVTRIVTHPRHPPGSCRPFPARLSPGR